MTNTTEGLKLIKNKTIINNRSKWQDFTTDCIDIKRLLQK